MTAFRSYTALALALPRVKPGLGQILNLYRYYWANRSRSKRACLSSRPVMFGLHVTYRCNLNCRFCYNTEVNRRGPEGDITVEEFRGFLTHPALQDAIRVTFTGGEPLLNPAIFEFIAMADGHRKLTYMTTNALPAEERLPEFERTPLTTLQVSLYAEHVEEQARSVAEVRRVNPRISIVLSQIVSTDEASWGRMEATMTLASRLGIRNVQFVAEQPTSGHDAQCFFDDNTVMLDYLREFRKKYGRKFALDLPDPLPRVVDNRRFCTAPFAGPYVGKGGSISPCCEILPPRDEMGNLSDPSFWNGAFLQRMRGEFDSAFPVHPRCRYCPNWVQGADRSWFV